MSRVIKPTHYIAVDDKRMIPVTRPEWIPNPPMQEPDANPADSHEDAVRAEQLNEIETLKQTIIQDAEASAESLLAQAAQEAVQIREQARAEIEQWWSDRRREDEAASEQARQDGFDAGYVDGAKQAEAEVLGQYEHMLDNAKTIIEQAVHAKQQITLEAEPFLIDLSCAIAEKIVGRQLTVEPEWFIEQIRRVLQRRKEQGIITLCVSPSQFGFVQDARDELVLAIDSQAELQILPDPTVREHGCVIRSSFGSIDARIDTQLDEIKKGLLQVAAYSEADSDE